MDISSLLKKKGWSGKEVGKLLISSMLHDIKQQRQEKKEPLFSQSDFDKIERTLSTHKDFVSYGVYKDLYRSIIDSFNRGQGLYQQFYNGFSNLFSKLMEAKNADKEQSSLDNTPLIMTESQYNRLKEEATNILKSYKVSFCSLVFHCLDNFLEKEEEAPEEIKKELKACKKTSVTENRFLSIYNETCGEGYYTLSDGKRSDLMASEEWQRAIKQEFVKKHQLPINGELESTEKTIEEYNTQKLLKAYELFFRGAQATRELFSTNGINIDDITDKEIEDFYKEILEVQDLGAKKINPKLDKLMESLGFEKYTKWHTYEEPPEGLNLYDLLKLYIKEYRGEFEGGGKEALKHLKIDAPRLYEVIKTYIENNVKQAVGLKSNQLHKNIVSWGELASTDLIGWKSLIEPKEIEIINLCTRKEDTENYSKRYRVINNGIAIIKNTNTSNIDENGDYIESKNQPSFFNSLFTTERDTYRAKSIQGYKTNLIYPAIGYSYAFNALMDIIAAVYDLPELPEVAKLDTSEFESKMRAYNNLIFMFYYDVYGDEAEKKEKRAVIKELFSPLEADSLKPTKESINEVREDIEKLGISMKARKKLKYLDKFINRLMDNGQGISK